MTIEKLFVVSNYNSNCEWIKNYGYDYLIFDRSDTDEFIFDKEKTIKVKNVGHNIYDYFTYFHDYYDNLPEHICLLKGNMFLPSEDGWQAYKYITKEKFDRLIHNKYYTALASQMLQQAPFHYLNCDGTISESTNKIVLHYVKYLTYPPLKSKFTISYLEFLNYIFKNPINTEFVQFSPGGCYIISKYHVLKYPKIFWLNLTKFMDYDNNPVESHIMERIMHTLFNCDYEITDHMKKELIIPEDPNGN